MASESIAHEAFGQLFLKPEWELLNILFTLVILYTPINYILFTHVYPSHTVYPYMSLEPMFTLVILYTPIILWTHAVTVVRLYIPCFLLYILFTHDYPS